jgi:hypothetical protein
LSHANQLVRSAAQDRLVELASQSIEPLKKLAAASDAALLARLHAIWALGQLAKGNHDLFSALAQLCTDKDDEIRAQAARTLSRAKGADEKTQIACGETLERLLSDPSPRVRRFAATSLGKIGFHGSLTKLVEMAGLHSEDPVLRTAIVIAMTGGHSPEELLDAAKGASEQARLVLTVALGRQKSPLIAGMLHDSSQRVVLEAARAIWDAPIMAAGDDLAARRGVTGPVPTRCLGACWPPTSPVARLKTSSASSRSRAAKALIPRSAIWPGR